MARIKPIRSSSRFAAAALKSGATVPGSKQSEFALGRTLYCYLPMTRSIGQTVKFFTTNNNDDQECNVVNGQIEKDFLVQSISILVQPGINMRTGGAIANSDLNAETEAASAWTAQEGILQLETIYKLGLFRLLSGSNELIKEKGLDRFPWGDGLSFSGNLSATLTAAAVSSLISHTNGSVQRGREMLRVPIALKEGSKISAQIDWPTSLSLGDPAAGNATDVAGFIGLRLHGVEYRESTGS